jgi:hypothetical protein
VLKTVFRLFPAARFIHMIRDGRDVVCSLRTHPKYRWDHGRRVPSGIINPWSACVTRWVHDTNAGLHWRTDPRYLEIRYEHLIAEPESTVRSILAWLDEPWEPDILDFHERHEEVGSDVANPGVRKPVYSVARGRWRTDLPEEALAAFTSDAHALLVDLGYADSDAWAKDVASGRR